MAAVMRGALHAVAGQAIGKVVAVSAWTLLISTVAHRLSPSHFGQFMLATNVAMLAVLLGSFGQPQLILYVNGRLGGNHRTALHRANSSRAALVTGGSAMIAAVGSALALSTVIDRSLIAISVCAFAAWVLGATWQTLLAEEAKTVSRFWTAGLFGASGGAGGAISTVAALICLLVAVPVVRQSTDLPDVLISLAIGTWASTATLIAFYLRDRPLESIEPLAPQRAPLTTREACRIGLIATFNAGLIFLIGQTDLWWSVVIFGIETSGQYAIATYLARFCSLLTILLSSAFAARFASMLALEGKGALSALIRRCAFLSVGAALVTAIGLAVASQVGILGSFFRLNDQDAVMAMLILSIGHVVGSLFGFGPVVLGASGRFADLLVITAASAMLTALLAAVASLTLGLAGLASAYAAGYVIFTYSCHRRCDSIMGIRPFHRAKSPTQ